jgi:YD repeat-containing protein
MEAVEGPSFPAKTGIFKSGLTYHFRAPTGEFDELPVERIADGSGNRIDLTRTEGGLSRIVISSGHSLDVHSEDGLIRSIQLKTGDEESSVLARCDYSPDGELLSASDPLGAKTRYEIDAGGTLSGIIDRSATRPPVPLTFLATS